MLEVPVWGLHGPVTRNVIADAGIVGQGLERSGIV